MVVILHIDLLTDHCYFHFLTFFMIHFSNVDWIIFAHIPTSLIVRTTAHKIRRRYTQECKNLASYENLEPLWYLVDQLMPCHKKCYKYKVDENYPQITELLFLLY